MLINKEIKSKFTLTRSDIFDIEAETTVVNFKEETFFSLFAEQDIVYEAAYDQLVALEDPDGDGIINKDTMNESFS